MKQLPDLKQLSETEKDLLIVELWQTIEQLKEKIELIKSNRSKATKTSQNSSIPPSKEFKENKQDTQKKSSPRKANRKGGGRKLNPNPDQIIVAQVKHCPHCQTQIGEVKPKLVALYEKIEIPPIKPIVTRIEQYGGYCHSCHQDYISPVPVGMEQGSPFGDTIMSLITYLRYTHAISYRRLSQLLCQVFNLSISEGAIANLLEVAKNRLNQSVEEIKVQLHQSKLVCSDETGARVKGKNQWEWVFQNEEVCLHVIKPTRGNQVIQEVMGDHQPEVWVSDLYSAQKNHPARTWQVCLAHQLRNCQYAIDEGDEVFAPQMKLLLLRALAIHQRREKLTESTLRNYGYDLKRRLRKILSLNPDQDDGLRLLKRYQKLEENLFLFVENSWIPPTNNSSEQAIRMSTVFRKVTNCFRSDWGKDLFAAVRSVVNTGARQGLSAYEAICKALSPNPSLFNPS